VPVLKSNRHIGFRHRLSMTLAVGQVTLAIMYLFPGVLTPDRPTTTRIVLELARVGPIWTVVFGLTGIAIVAALRVHKVLHVAHAATGSVWVGFVFALVLSAIANSGTYLLPALAAVLAVVNFVLAVSYSEDMGREEP
jgi:peptidoglycan/LPS O-acetylase OafA/YrhL